MTTTIIRPRNANMALLYLFSKSFVNNRFHLILSLFKSLKISKIFNNFSARFLSFNNSKSLSITNLLRNDFKNIVNHICFTCLSKNEKENLKNKSIRRRNEEKKKKAPAEKRKSVTGNPAIHIMKKSSGENRKFLSFPPSPKDSYSYEGFSPSVLTDTSILSKLKPTHFIRTLFYKNNLNLSHI